MDGDQKSDCVQKRGLSKRESVHLAFVYLSMEGQSSDAEAHNAALSAADDDHRDDLDGSDEDVYEDG